MAIYMRPISGEPEALTNTHGTPPPQFFVVHEKEKHYRIQGVKVQTLQKMGGMDSRPKHKHI